MTTDMVALDSLHRSDTSGTDWRSASCREADVAPASHRVEWRPLASCVDIVEPWKALAARALEPNVFYEPAFALAAAPIFGPEAGAILVWSAVEPDRLLGLLPLRIERRRYGLPLPVLVGWTHPYAPFGAPLIERDHAGLAIAAALDFIARHDRLPDLLVLPLMPTEGALAAALAHAMLGCEAAVAWFPQRGRALLMPALERAGYLDRALPGKKRKELRRQGRRLGEQGKLYVASTSEPSRIHDALDAFMTLEAQGWKGRARTAAALDPGVGGFMRRAVRALAAGGQARIDRLMLGERVIAAAILLRSGSAAWFWKIAYDEALARASPGVQLTLELTESLLADPSVGRVDSCATPDHPMIDHLWRGRLMLADQLIAVGPRAQQRLLLAHGLEAMRRAAIDAAKWLRGLLRRTCSQLG